MYDARRSSQTGGSRRHRAGRAASISWVNAPNAHMRPQYSRPHSTVDTNVNVASRYHARLYLKIGRFRSRSPKMLTTEMSWLFAKPSSATHATSVTYLSRRL